MAFTAADAKAWGDALSVWKGVFAGLVEEEPGKRVRPGEVTAPPPPAWQKALPFIIGGVILVGAIILIRR